MKLLGLFAVVAVAALPAGAAVITSGSSTADIDFSSDAGMKSWNVGGADQLNQQWFWYRIGTAGREYAINTISAPTITSYAANHVNAVYTGAQFSLSVDYLLTSASATEADIVENIKITNLTGSSLNLHFFQYSDFNLGGTAGGDSIQINYDPVGMGYDGAVQTKGPGLGIAETINDPLAKHAEAALTPATLNKLNDALTTTLSDVLTAGPGDAAWALQWEFNIPANGSQEVFKDKHLLVALVPEPTAAALGALGLLAFALRKRR